MGSVLDLFGRSLVWTIAVAVSAITLTVFGGTAADDSSNASRPITDHPPVMTERTATE